MNTSTHISFFDAFVFLGVFQGLLISWFFLKKGRKVGKEYLYQGLLISFLSATIFEEWLNNTGYITRVLVISNYSEWMNFTFGPLLYLVIKHTISPGKAKSDKLHFILAGFWLLYMIPHFIQPNELKYNSYLGSKHPDWEFIDATMIWLEDPFGIRPYINTATAFHFLLYIILSVVLIAKKLKSSKQSFFKTNNVRFRMVRNSFYHFVIIVIIFVGTKLYFGADIGDYFIASYISFMIYSTSIQILNNSNYFDKQHSIFDFPSLKYKKPSLAEDEKVAILKKIMVLKNEKYFLDNMASLSGLAKSLGESSHHVSQVINEKLQKTFYEWLAWCRVEEAKQLLQKDTGAKLTIEDLADTVGYNSKSTFNKVFKQITSQTPSEYRKPFIKT